jgi:hypothetical protein
MVTLGNHSLLRNSLLRWWNSMFSILFDEIFKFKILKNSKQGGKIN